MSTAEPDLLLFQTSPWGSLDAIVQHDGRAVCFCLNGPPSFGTRACWVANLVPGPLEFSQTDLTAGQFPVLPRVHQHDQTPVPLPASDELEVVWFESGDAAALFWRGQLASVIPPWSGLGGFHGYAANCATHNLVCSPFPPEGKLEARVQQAVAYWQRWRDAPPFRTWQPACLRQYAERFGTQEQYWSVDGGQFPPRGIARFRDASGAVRLLTVGMALAVQPEPRTEQAVAGYWPTIELGLDITRQADDPVAVRPIVAGLASLAARPWRALTWLGPGHSCVLPVGENRTLRAILQADEGAMLVPASAEATGDPSALSGENTFVQLIWVVPS